MSKGRRFATLTLIAMASGAWLAPGAARSEYRSGPIRQLLPPMQELSLPEPALRTVANRSQRRFPARGQPHGSGRRTSHGTPGCFHGVGKFGGGCR